MLGERRDNDGLFVDAFCGTGVVAAAAADAGWPVRVNDSLSSAVATASALLVSREDVPFRELGGYEAAIAQLNATRPIPGFFWREYSPAGPPGRLYFSETNAARIDAVRVRVKRWRQQEVVDETEHRLLLADLIAAAGRVANIAGTYGCYLSRWTPAALQSFSMRPRALRAEPVVYDAHCGDVTQVPSDSRDVTYFDPPYTKRQYAAYYHINETLAREDEPDVGGKTGLRPWEQYASDYCYKRRALTSLTNLIEGTRARRILLSYSSEGHVALDDLEVALSALGTLSVHGLGSIGRYRPNGAASAAASGVTEYLLEVCKLAVAAPTTEAAAA